MDPTPPPIACDLDALALDERHREAALLEEFKALRPAATATPNGYAFVIDPSPTVIARVGELVALERLCCPFLSFDLAAPAGREPVTLHIHGGPGAKEFVRDTFVWR